MTSKAQLGFYWGLWRQVEARLVKGGFTAEQVEEKRHAVHVEALGYDKSSSKLGRDEFTRVRRKFEALLVGEDLNTQLGIDRAPEELRVESIRRVLTAMGKDEGYVLVIARRIFGDGRPELLLEDLTAEELDVVFQKLKDRARAVWPTTEDLRRVIDERMAARELDRETVRETVVERMGEAWRARLARPLKYEDLIVVLAVVVELTTEAPF